MPVPPPVDDGGLEEVGLVKVGFTSPVASAARLGLRGPSIMLVVSMPSNASAISLDSNNFSMLAFTTLACPTHQSQSQQQHNSKSRPVETCV